MNIDDIGITRTMRVHEKATPMAVRRTGCLFGLAAAEVGQSTVLEIGCGAGANLVSLALLYPLAKFKGMDESKPALRQARSTAKKLGLRNVTFEQVSLQALEVKGRYEYILVPGVYSWISDDQRSRVLQQVSQGLAENGLAMFSYNTFPGWNSARTVREMMLFHTRHFDDLEKKISEARKMLNFVLANNEGKDTPYTKALTSELNLIQTLEDYYFFKEYLSDVNEPVYFADFLVAAKGAGLNYVGDMDLEFMYLGNYNELAQTQLGELTTAVQQEQYMDFIVNRRVRNTVLGKTGAVNRAIDADRLKDFKFRLKLLPVDPIVEETYKNGEVTLMSPSNNEITVKVAGREQIAFVQYMVSLHPGGMGIDEISEGAADKAGMGVAEARTSLGRFLVGAIASGVCTADKEPDLFVLQPSEKPAVFALASHQSASQVIVSNARHQTVQVSSVDQLLMPLLNGERGIKELVEGIEKYVESGDLSLSISSKKDVAGTPDQLQIIRALIEERLRFYAINALLVA